VSDLSQFDLDPSRTALLAIDFQNDFCHADGFFARAGHDVSSCQEAAERTAWLIEQVRPHGIPVIWTRSANTNPRPYGLPPLRFRRPRQSDAFVEGQGGTNVFEPGSWGHAIVDELVPGPDDLVLDKLRYNAFHNTGLDEELRGRGIDTLLVTGVTTNCCVESTSRDAFMRDFDVAVVSDGSAAFRNEEDLHEASLRNLSLFFAVIATAADVAERLAVREPALG
jgi:ureidoacrylate peracid hydrolase